jgi:GNAT superfamily N-acetyltransferase
VVHNISYLELKSEQALPYLDEIARLRIEVFAEWPYIYFQSKNSYIVLAKVGEKIVGASTAVWLPEAEEFAKKPFRDHKFKLESVCYFGESVLSQQYRGLKIGKRFMELREAFARSVHDVKFATFCAVIREKSHPLKPKDYVPLYGFWNKMGFQEKEGMVTTYDWRDIGESQDTKKLMQFWLKDLHWGVNYE